MGGESLSTQGNTIAVAGKVDSILLLRKVWVKIGYKKGQKITRIVLVEIFCNIWFKKMRGELDPFQLLGHKEKWLELLVELGQQCSEQRFIQSI